MRYKSGLMASPANFLQPGSATARLPKPAAPSCAWAGSPGLPGAGAGKAADRAGGEFR